MSAQSARTSAAPARATTISTMGPDLLENESAPEPIVTKTRRRRTADQPSLPLGSLTQATYRPRRVCANCGSSRVTQLTIAINNEPMQFLSCHRCEHRTWGSEDQELSVDTVIDRASKR